MKKYASLIVLAIVLAAFIALLIHDNLNNKKDSDTKPTKPVITESTNTKKDIQNDNPLSTKEYEEIMRNFIDAKNFAIEKGNKTFLEDFLEKGSKFEGEILEDVKRQNKANYGYVVFEKVENIKGKVHTVKFKTSNGEEKIFKIKSRNGNYLILDEK